MASVCAALLFVPACRADSELAIERVQPAPRRCALLPRLTEHNLLRVPLTRQSTDFTCGAAALQAVLGYFGEDIREQQLAHELGTNSYDGTNFRRINKYAREHGYDVNAKTEMTLEELKQQLDSKVPVICLIQAWSEKKNPDYASDWDDGHYVVAVGYDADKVYFMDPSTLGHYTFIPVNEFVARWHDREQHTHLNHLGISIRKSGSEYDANAITKID